MKLTSREMYRIASLIDQVVGDLDVRAADAGARDIVRHEARTVLDDVASLKTQGAVRLTASLKRLIVMMEVVDAPQAPTRSRATLSLKALARAFAALAGGAVAALPVFAAAASIGDVVVDPTTGTSMQVIEIVDQGFVVKDNADNQYFVYSPPAVGSEAVVHIKQEPDGSKTEIRDTILRYTVSGGGTATSVVWVNGFPTDGSGNAITGVIYGTPASGSGETAIDEVVAGSVDVFVNLGGGVDEHSTDIPPNSGDQNRSSTIRAGKNGSNGRTGAIFVPASSGGAGASGQSIGSTNSPHQIGISSPVVSAGGSNAPGVIVASIGGNGGKGGSSYLNLAGGGKAGGRGGSGGDVNVTLGGGGPVATNGQGSHGVVVQSRAGVGGNGGSGWATTGGGGAGGSAASGGTVVADVNLNITTHGNGSHGLLVQSLGGGAGNSGSSYGLFGATTNGGWGGDGGDVAVTSRGHITTGGAASHGVLAQSIGGTGGDAGATGGIVAFGGGGGSGGNGGAVNLTVASGTITTKGDGSFGVIAQSIGGSGGNAGRTSGIAALGASGAEGGHGGKVTVQTDAGSRIVTQGGGSVGVVAQSIGGGGGNAGVSGGLVALGGAGSKGGDADVVRATINGSVTTLKEGAHGVLAQSIGGGGGSGKSAGGLVALGGTGAGGGDADEVHVAVGRSGSIATTGTAARGIVAQSIGGGGGDAGTTGGLVALGGKGAGGGSGARVDVLNDGQIETQGAGSDGVLAQSIGGGGGAGGGSGGFVALGGSGGVGGDGGIVDVVNNGRITTEGALSRGVLAQSIGGGGGAAGSGGGVFSAGGSGGAGGNASIGGSSSQKNDGGAVGAENTGLIQTKGNMSSAIQAQSIGGGGGDGANANGVFLALGGSGGKGGDGGAVRVENSGELHTAGADSHGVFAQSIGGGGGNGGWTTASGIIAAVAIGGDGSAGGKGGHVTVQQATSDGDKGRISTQGDRSSGVIAQSIGGGGGNGGYSVATSLSVGAGFSVALGGSGAGGGDGGQVDYKGYADVTTRGQGASGVLLQSIGGGGGNGGFSIASNVTGLLGVSVAVGIGGSGGAGGAGGDIEISDAGGDIITTGAFSSGLTAQSIGGGGGNGGYSIGASVLGGAGAAVTATIGGSGGDGGRAGIVRIDYTGDVETQGLGSTGVLLQSISGGGGSGGYSVAAAAGIGAAAAITVGIGGSGGKGGDGNTVDGVLKGDIKTFGELSSGFVAQSIGGGGGDGGFSVSGAVSGGVGGAGIAVGIGGTGGGGGNGGDVTVTLDGSIYTDKAQSTGFVAQSLGGGGGNGGFNVSGTIAAGLGAGAVSVGIGGNGGGGGDGGYVNAAVTDAIHTKGALSGGFVAQSIGGGGGNGGYNVSGSIAAGLGAGSASVGLGGFGAQGGDAGEVWAAAADIRTEGLASTGFLAQSVGGSGGSGGFNVSSGIAGGLGAGTVNVGLGGFGGGGGDGNLVNATIAGDAVTLRDLSSAIVAQSLGGGGGSGGYNVTGGIAGGIGGGTIGVGLGGFGAGGGDGGEVTLAVTGDVDTNGLASKGVVAQSIGGGGGDGGFNVTGGIAGGVGAGAIGVGLGGSGGGGGHGDLVKTIITGDVVTRGKLASGVVAQSLGGGGGSGGFNVVGGIGGGVGAGTINVGLGGTGAGGGDGGEVQFEMTGKAFTEGLMATAVVLQSVGGGGGDGGFNVVGGIAGGIGSGTINVGLGGNAGTGGRADKVTGELLGLVSTLGDMSAGVVAQSLGGGGGNGGFNVTGGIAGGGVGSGAVNVGLGGSGGGGGDAGAVSMDVAFTEIIDNLELAIVTNGALSSGLVAQSIGGGGGQGAFNVTGGVAAAGTGSGTVNVGLGGSGGSGGDGDAVSVSLTGAVVTQGPGSGGVIAQSLGGGGGSGGFNVTGGVSAAGTGAGTVSVALGGTGGDGGHAGAVDVTHIGGADASGLQHAIWTGKNDSTGILAQSIGGGGGNGGFNVNGSVAAAGTGAGSVGVGLGGGGGGGGNADTVNVDVLGLVQTKGDNSRGVVAQSLGGGGGDGGFNVTGGVGAAGTGAGSVMVGVGGFGGGGGDAADVVLKAVGGTTAQQAILAALTEGDNATAFTAQSIGGGGGTGGFNVTGSVSGAGTGGGSVAIGLGGAGGLGGNAGDVQADVTGYIGTQGKDSGGVLAQSIGGGGGSGGFNIAGGVSGGGTGAGNLVVGIGGMGGGGGDAGKVAGIVRSDIETLGDGGFGLAYQSLGGGGGAGGMNISAGVSLAKSGAGNVTFGLGGFGGDGGQGGEVDLDHIGDIYTKGEYAFGILAQSVGGGGGAGGMNIAGGASFSKETAGNLSFGIGGMGGLGGDAGVVKAVLAGDVVTKGANAFGALMQSLGGAGGAGGMNITGGLAASAGTGGAASISGGLGGFGGSGGDAADVTGTVTGVYLTEGDYAYGVAAQSLGGGGGTGGINISGAVAIGKGDPVSAAIGVGGFGGLGGDAADVSLDRVGDTQTLGGESDAVLIQSIGGGGGAGGMNISGSLSLASKDTATGLSLGLGGFGGSGGNAGDVKGDVQGNVWAKGALNDYVETFTNEDGEDVSMRHRVGGSNGVVAQSIGGGGGSGGINISASVALSKPKNSAARTLVGGVGGFGGGGGDAGRVDLTVGSASAALLQMQANGDNRSAVIAQSIGGGGGNGGMNIAGGLAMNGSATLGVGGFGGDGGHASSVDATVFADVFAAGNLSRGLMFQSIGGGGGAGAINISGGVQAAPGADEPMLVFGLGGFGGAGGLADDVTGFHKGDISVEGVDSIGALVQSISGGGGSGGLNVSAALSLGDKKSFAIAAGIGGTGGAGDDAGNVDYTSIGNIFVGGALVSDGKGGATFEAVENTGGGAGIVAQSIGGGGGVGGINVTGAVSRKGSPIAFGMGGSGGSGGDGGRVTVTRGYEDVSGALTAAPGYIMTSGDGTAGLVAQSIGGGGGRAGHNLVIGLKPTGNGEKGNEVAALIAVGGAGAGAGSGGEVAVNHNGVIITDGNMASAISAQSIGGGGGDASYNIGAGVFKGAKMALNMAVGGGTGAGGTGGDVSVAHVGDLQTAGDYSYGILAQSIGGGGGNVGMDMAVGILAESSLSLTLGRQGGTGGEAGKVSVDATGRILTSGVNANAIFAQSIGGGGGASGVIAMGGSKKNKTAAGKSESTGGSISIGIEGGIAATADDVKVAFDGTIVTQGEGARGVLAQSIGGGGGAGGSASATLFMAANSANLSIGATGGDGALSGDVYVTNDGDIITLGGKFKPEDDEGGILAGLFGKDAKDYPAEILVNGAASSDGILAQAIGGGGGIGGSARTLGFQVAGGEDMKTATVSVGGAGGTGARGGRVFVDNTKLVSTEGDGAFGIRAQSIGGGGGIGGSVISATLQGPSKNTAVELNIGGAGGDGGAGDLVQVVNTGAIVTQGANAAGISANSIGGGGGDAGIMLALTLNASGMSKDSTRAVTNIGGSGGVGGAGGDVIVRNTKLAGVEHSGLIQTEGARAYGVLAQSIGGGGGNGSTVVAVQAGVASKESMAVGLNVGGMGGRGESGGSVLAENSGIILTHGEYAHGILAQSVGGGGGNGGLVVAANALIGKGSTALKAQTANVGGFGGSGGDGGRVEVRNSGTIITRGDGAHGIQAQSIGGGGGNANLVLGGSTGVISSVISQGLSAGIGAIGSSGGVGGEVLVDNSGDIAVFGANAVGIKAESINGGGGTLKLDLHGLVSLPGAPAIGASGLPETPDVEVIARLGGEGSSGMNAARVTVRNTGDIWTQGDAGAASLAQSIGGGGGALEMVLRTKDDAAGGVTVPLEIAVALGGLDGTGNAGADMSLSQQGLANMKGAFGTAVMAQSIGGGGGRAMLDLGATQASQLGQTALTFGAAASINEAGGDLNSLQDGAVVASGAHAVGSLMQSIGGGGGSGIAQLQGVNGGVAATMGGDNVVGADGGRIDLAMTGQSLALGDGAVGLLLQSIGAGGGELRLNGASSADVVLGASGASTGNGQAIDLSHTGMIGAIGAQAYGVLLQSIGGGGGAVFGAGEQTQVVTSSANTGDGGDIRFVLTGDLIAGGEGGHGLIAQSLGGGGGWVGGHFAGSAGGAGAGGAISLDIDGAIQTSGAGGTGLFAQSAGRDGAGPVSITHTGNMEVVGDGARGVYAQAQGAGGRIDIARTGHLHAWGADAVGVQAQATGAIAVEQRGDVLAVDAGSVGFSLASTGGDISLDLEGYTRGGSGDGAGVVFEGGRNNSLITRTSLSSVNGMAMRGGTGNDRAINEGLVFGNIDLGGGSNSFLNAAGATFMTFDTIRLRDASAQTASASSLLRSAAVPSDDAVFTNDGLLRMGLEGTAWPLDLLAGETFGDLDGLMAPELNPYYGARVISTVALDGHFVQTANGRALFDVAFGRYASDRVNVTGDATFSGALGVNLIWLENAERVTLFATGGQGSVVGDIDLPSTLALDFAMQGDDAGVHLLVSSDFGRPLQRPNETALGGHMDSALQEGGAARIGRLMAALGNMVSGQEDLYRSIFYELNPEGHVASMQTQYYGASTFARQMFSCGLSRDTAIDRCVWGQGSTTAFDQEETGEYWGATSRMFNARVGVEQRLNADWVVSGSAGYNSLARQRVDRGRMNTQGDGFDVGVGLQRTTQNGSDLRLNVTGGWQWLESQRYGYVFESMAGLSKGQNGYAQLGAEVGHTIRAGDFFLRPAINVSGTALHTGAYKETGWGGLGARVVSDTQYIGSIEPKFTTGWAFDPARGVNAAFALSAGRVHRSEDGIYLPIQLIGSAQSSEPAKITTPLDASAWNVGFEAKIHTDSGVSFHAGYEGQLGDKTEVHTGSISVRWTF